tara:strand:- start:458 stop:637 length:180 start_codon:yes stop_codon:yes gene_type:complete
MSEQVLKEKIIEIIENISIEYWNNCSKTERPEMSKEELEFTNYQNHKASEEIIKLFKNK